VLAPDGAKQSASTEGIDGFLELTYSMGRAGTVVAKTVCEAGYACFKSAERRD
jgi:hypothetical protein